MQISNHPFYSHSLAIEGEEHSQSPTNSGLSSQSDPAQITALATQPQPFPPSANIANSASHRERRLRLAELAVPTAGQHHDDNIDMAPYRRLEQQHAALFAAGGIVATSARQIAGAGVVTDVDMDQCLAISTAEGGQSIGTKSLSTCIAICGRGKDASGHTVLGINHYSGIDEADDALNDLMQAMADKGAKQVSIHLVGGCAMPDEDESSLQTEKDLLALKNDYPITAARLHVSQGEDEDGDPNYVNLVMTADKTYYGSHLTY